MTAVACASPPLHDLPNLIDRRATMLSGAKNAAEVLEAREAPVRFTTWRRVPPGCSAPKQPMTISLSLRTARKPCA